MCLSASTELPDPTLIIDPITEERASRTLYRIELLRRIREQVLPHPLLSERLKLCQPSQDLPEWWECGRHDRDLLLGASKHGVSRTDYHIQNDPTLGFLEAHRRLTTQRGTLLGMGELCKSGTGTAESSPSALLTPAELASVAVSVELAAHGAEAEGERTQVKTEEDVQTEARIELEEEEASAVTRVKTASPEKMEAEEVEVKDEKEATASPVSQVDEARPVAEKETSGPIEENTENVSKQTEQETVARVDTAGDQMILKDPEELEAQTSHSAAEEEDRVQREDGKSPKSPKSPDTEKSPEEEERMDEDDKSEKSSQAEGGGIDLIAQ